MFDASSSELSASAVRCLQVWLVLGGLFDLAGAFEFFFRPARVERLLKLPEELGFWPMYATVFLIVLALFYFVTALDPARSIANVGVAIMGRLLGASFYFNRGRAAPGRQTAMFAFAAANVAFAAIYAGILWGTGWRLLVASLH